MRAYSSSLLSVLLYILLYNNTVIYVFIVILSGPILAVYCM